MSSNIDPIEPEASALSRARDDIDAMIDDPSEGVPRSAAEARGGRPAGPPRDPFAGTPPDDPFRIAAAYLGSRTIDGVPTLAYHRGEFLAYAGGAWAEEPEPEVRRRVARAVHEFLVAYNLELAATEDKPRPRRFSVNCLNATMEALRSTAGLDVADAPAWIGDAPPHAPRRLVSTLGGLVELGSLADGVPVVHPATPRFFTRTALDFALDGPPPPPETWLRFLAESVWPGDDDSIRTLRLWFGYVLSGRTDLQKILLLIGPPRSGKGIVARVLARLIGRRNVTGPSLARLGDRFGMVDLIGASLAIFGDVRLGARADQAAIVAALLGISGEDAQTVERKFKLPWRGKVGARLMILGTSCPG